MGFTWFKRKKKTSVSAPEGHVIYAIGDVHGREDLLSDLVTKIEADLQSLGKGLIGNLVFLGDYVDRGLGSKGVLNHLLVLEKKLGEGEIWGDVYFLKGNHEEALLHFLEDPGFGEQWLVHGGTETLLSYGVSPPKDQSDAHEWREVSMALKKALGGEHRSFMERLQSSVILGDYIFVHAGLRPGKPIEQQTEQDMLWIRKDFLSSTSRFEKKVVHGHSPKKLPYNDHRRIGVDTGAYITGVLTAVRLEGDKVSFLHTGEN